MFCTPTSHPVTTPSKPQPDFCFFLAAHMPRLRLHLDRCVLVFLIALRHGSVALPMVAVHKRSMAAIVVGSLLTSNGG